jgi:Immunoglobulin I-set domain
VKEGETATFTCQLTGEPEPEVVWLHNDRPVGTGDRYVVTKAVDKQTYTLQLKSTTLSDAGTFEVVATNQFGRATCDTTLDVEGYYFLLMLDAISLF